MSAGATSAPEAPQVAPTTALVLLAAALVAAALIGVGLGGLVTVGDVVASSGRSSDEGLAPVPAAAAPPPGASSVAPAVAFAIDGSTLPPGLLGAWEETAGDWAVEGGQALVRSEQRGPSLALVETPSEARLVAITLTSPSPGAGLVVDHRGPSDHLELVVASSGRAVELRRVRPDGPVVILGAAPLTAPGEPVVLAIERRGDEVDAIANGTRVISRVDRDRGPGARIGLTAGPGRAGEAARFDDLVVVPR